MTGEWMVVGAVVAVAVGYLAWSFGRSLRAAPAKPACAACPARGRNPAGP
jgi:hypothetical protein